MHTYLKLNVGFNQVQCVFGVILQAVTWCPWQPNVLASGGGTADRHIRLWNANTGNVLSATNTDSQVIC